VGRRATRPTRVFAANPHSPIFNPYTHRSYYTNKRYLKHKRNRRHKRKEERQFKLSHAQQQERDQNPETKKKKYGWIPHNAGFGFLDLAPSILHSNWFWDYIS
jgi:hypothetical protein